jgi:hypothetical protein
MFGKAKKAEKKQEPSEMAGFDYNKATQDEPEMRKFITQFGKAKKADKKPSEMAAFDYNKVPQDEPEMRKFITQTQSLIFDYYNKHSSEISRDDLLNARLTSHELKGLIQNGKLESSVDLSSFIKTLNDLISNIEKLDSVSSGYLPPLIPAVASTSTYRR